jgi:hypothetical protein
MGPGSALASSAAQSTTLGSLGRDDSNHQNPWLMPIFAAMPREAVVSP